MRRSTPRIVPHHFKPRACLWLLSQCCAFRKAERVPRCVGTSCWSSGHSKSATFALPRGNALFHVFAFVCPSHKGAGEAATKGARHEVLHQILWRDKSGSHQLFFSVLFIDRRCLRMFGTSGSGAAVICNIVFALRNSVPRACFPLWCFPVVRRTAVDISVYDELHDVRCGISFFCAHTSILRCTATIGWDNRGRSTCCLHRLHERDVLVFSPC